MLLYLGISEHGLCFTHSVLRRSVRCSMCMREALCVSAAGKPLSDERLLPEVSILFMAGFESEPFDQYLHGHPFAIVRLLAQ